MEKLIPNFPNFWNILNYLILWNFFIYSRKLKKKNAVDFTIYSGIFLVKRVSNILNLPMMWDSFDNPELSTGICWIF